MEAAPWPVSFIPEGSPALGCLSLEPDVRSSGSARVPVGATLAGAGLRPEAERKPQGPGGCSVVLTLRLPGWPFLAFLR